MVIVTFSNFSEYLLSSSCVAPTFFDTLSIETWGLPLHLGSVTAGSVRYVRNDTGPVSRSGFKELSSSSSCLLGHSHLGLNHRAVRPPVPGPVWRGTEARSPRRAVGGRPAPVCQPCAGPSPVWTLQVPVKPRPHRRRAFICRISFLEVNLFFRAELPEENAREPRF